MSKENDALADRLEVWAAQFHDHALQDPELMPTFQQHNRDLVEAARIIRMSNRPPS